jgi:anaerobic magnesium-protoporphyrin IX monomethyl ester cyclase
MRITLVETTSLYHRMNPLIQMDRLIEPLAIEYIGGYLEERCAHDVVLLHQIGTNNEEAAELVATGIPELVGLSCMTCAFPDAQELARLVKKRLPETPIVLGGYHALALDECPDAFDFVIRGEGEEAMGHLAEFLNGKRTIAQIKGLTFYRDPVTGLSKRAKTYLASPTLLQQLPWPKRLPRSPYFSLSMGENMPDSRIACTTLARGCPYSCDFCCTPEMFPVRNPPRTVRSVVDEIELLKSEFGVNVINVRDETFAPESLVRGFSEELCRRKVDVAWRAFATVGSLSRECLQIMAESGCRMLFYGIEASDPDTLRVRGKSFAKQFDRVAIDIHNAQSEGIFVRGGFIIGHENDTEETFVRHLSYLKQIRPDELYLSFLTPFPGTPLYRKAVSENRIDTGDFRRFDCEHPVLKIAIPPDQLSMMRTTMYREYYASNAWLTHLSDRLTRSPEDYSTIDKFLRFTASKIGAPEITDRWEKISIGDNLKTD